MLAQGTTMIDVRDVGSFSRGHIPGARNLDLHSGLTEASLRQLASPDQKVIFHCWGLSCKFSALACAKALLWGYTQVYYFAGGIPAWKEAGYPVAVETQ